MKFSELLSDKIGSARGEVHKVIYTPRYDSQPDLKLLKQAQTKLDKLVRQGELYHRYEFVPKKIKKISHFKKMLKEQ